MSSINTETLLTQTQSLLTLSQSPDFFNNSEYYTTIVDCLIDHNHLYYIENNPLLSDSEYDHLFNLLKEFESLHPEHIRDDSPTQRLI